MDETKDNCTKMVLGAKHWLATWWKHLEAVSVTEEFPDRAKHGAKCRRKN